MYKQPNVEIAGIQASSSLLVESAVVNNSGVEGGGDHTIPTDGD